MATHARHIKEGFTLIELLVAAGVIAFVSVIMTQVLFSSMHVNTKTELLKEIKQTGNVTLDSITRLIQSAKTITSPCDGVSTLSITGLDGGVTTLLCMDDGDISRIASVGSQTVYMTSDNVTLIDANGQTGCVNTPLLFTCTDVGGTASVVGVTFRLQQKNAAGARFEEASDAFQTTVTVRNFEK